MPWIGHVVLDRIHMGTLEPWVEQRRHRGAAQGTINHGLQIVRRILNLAAAEWVDEEGLTELRKLLPSPRKTYSRVHDTDAGAPRRLRVYRLPSVLPPIPASARISSAELVSPAMARAA